MIKTTNQQKKFWKERKIDWAKDYLSTWNHPHRQLIIWALQTFQWVSLWETGVGAGANLARIVKESETNPVLQGKQLGGSDVNEDAIELCRKTFTNGRFHVESSEDMLLSDNAVDVMLSDASLIYIGPRKIQSVVNEMTRIARNHIVLCEFHSTNWWNRMMLRFQTGYNAYNYQNILEKAGCYDIQLIKIPQEFWDGTPWVEFGYIIIAKITQ